ncbi:MAG: MarR family winged helix-turn-helix transcriptional regulator [Pseudonocardiaceae bacterium]
MSFSTVRPPSLLALPSYLTSQVAKFGYHYLANCLREHDLLLGHHAVLTALDDFGPLSQQRLANCLNFDKSHLVGRIDHLEQRGLVARMKDPADRRRHQVTVTPEGQALLAELRPVAEMSQQQFLDTLTDSERETLMTLLRRVLDANDAARLGAESEPPARSA